MSTDEILHVSKCKEDFAVDIFIHMDQNTIPQIELKNRGQSDYSDWL